ncbi:aldo/keto reductase [Sinomonas atrocyanea]
MGERRPQTRRRLPGPVPHPLAQPRPGHLCPGLGGPDQAEGRGEGALDRDVQLLPRHLQRLIDATGVAPDVDQLQISPYWVKHEARAFNLGHGTVTESYTPIGRGQELLAEEAVVSAARAHGVTPAQAVLRWHTQHGLVAIPKSAHPERLAANLDVFGFDLTGEELAALDALDGRGPEAADPETFGH